MTIISIATGSVPEARANYQASTAIALFCCFGLVVSLCLMTFGIDLSAG
jgi:hypothetical protein